MAAHSHERWAFQADDASILHALARGQQRRSLSLLFGGGGYAELCELAARAAAARRHAQRRSGRPAPRALILPGIMGSRLGFAASAGAPAKVLWIDPWRIAAGDLKYLDMRRPRRLTALGVMLFDYAKLKLTLDIEGFDARFHAYDWRLSIEGLGRELAGRIARLGREVCIVAHSMGGLVARAAMRRLPFESVPRLIMLGTPNFGTFAPLQALCGSYPGVRRIMMLDLKNSADDLRRRVFSGFPGLYQLLPRTADARAIDLFDSRLWPKRLSNPDPGLLAAARGAGEWLAAPDRRMRQIIGTGRATVLCVRRAAGGFEYGIGHAGDGTVPVELAFLPGVDAYFVRDLHGRLANNADVIAAVADLLRSGRTMRLRTLCKPARGARVRVRITDAQLRRMFRGKIDWRELDGAQRERLLGRLADREDPTSDP